ncbi:MAG: hypothetical protein J6S83_06750 [Lachnospiraceae bacterium]|nr:hypothetical protein [Lachnospiraceae bacterium]
MSVGAVNKQTGDRIPTAGMTVVDSVLSGSSTNPVQNRVVKAALDGKADTDIVASDFDATASYTAGDYCIYDGKFYKFKASHSGAWAAADVDEIKIAGELSSLKSGLNKPCTFTEAENVTFIHASIAVNNSNVNISLMATMTCTAGTWVSVGTVSKRPSDLVVTAGVRSGDGSYLGMVEISTQGLIRLYPTQTISANDGLAFSIAYRTND